MTTVGIKTSFGSGGANLVPGGSGGEPDLATALRAIADALNSIKPATVSAGAGSSTAASDAGSTTSPNAAVTAVADVGETTGVADGLIVGAPTTPSSQAVNPGGETDWNVNVSAGYAFVNSVGKYNAAQVDVNISTGVKILEIGEAIYAWLVWAEAGGVVTQVVVLGVAGLLGAETIPDDTAITAGVGHANWCKIALCHASRTADAVVATTENPSLMKKWGGAGTTLINDLKAKYNAAVTLLNEVKADYNLAVTLANELKSDLNGVVTLVNELRTKAIAMAAVTVGIVSA